MSIINKVWISYNALNAMVKPMKELLIICRIGSNYLLTSYILINLHFPGIYNGKTAIAKIRIEIYIVNQLLIGVLIRIDILEPYKFILDLAGQLAYI